MIKCCVVVQTRLSVAEMASSMLLDKLKKARRLKDPQFLDMAINECKEAGVGDDEDVTKAETQLRVIRLKQSKTLLLDVLL